MGVEDFGGDVMGRSIGRKTAPDRDPAPSIPKGESFDWRTFDPAMLPGGPDTPLAAELATYREHLDEMLTGHLGEYVIIKGDRVVGYHPSRRAAIKAAFRSFGREPVLVKRVVDSEPVRRLGGTSG